jgi:enoyl-CoA hydratase/carnithine racemase
LRLVPFATLRYEVAERVATIALDGPGTRNALSEQVLGDLLDAFVRARDDDDVRCVVLASTHETVFSSGGDLTGFAADTEVVERQAALFPRLFTLIGELGKPVICAAGGHVLAGALGLALACDLVIASERATFGTPEVAVGLFPFMVSALLARNVGRKTCSELLLLGERIDAHEALRAGIVNRVVAPAELDATVAEWARKIAARSPLVMKLGKDALWRTQDMPLASALDVLQAQLTIAAASDDAKEGIAAFLERREARWSGR